MRTVAERIEWFREHKPSAVGMCLRHTWLATDIPSVGMPDANAGAAYVRKHKRMHTDRKPPRGAWVWWASSNHGHVAIALGDERIVSTDVYGPATVGTVHQSFPETSWGQTYIGWSKWYGVPFAVTQPPRVRISDRIRDTIDKIRPLRRLLDRLRNRRKDL